MSEYIKLWLMRLEIGWWLRAASQKEREAFKLGVIAAYVQEGLDK
jgi:hypothetical protein